MTVYKDRIGGLIFLALALGYGYSATLIPQYPGDEYEVFTAKTLPFVLAVLGGFLSLALLLSSLREERKRIPNYNWQIAAKLIGLMVIYGAVLEYLGFLIATALFLLVGYWLLGERRKLVLFMCSGPLVIFFWYVLTQLLEIYLAPGALLQSLGVS
ncbi:MAG: tripartite tricarboxylate transporter TctB family protein [Pseudomonadales bacterium]